jgi:D-alanyl-D-alanine carboxypeptidase (penicillin-binding protein 5/6)
MAALFLTFVAVTGSVGTVAAAGAGGSPRPTPRVLPSAGQGRPLAGTGAAGTDSGPRPGIAGHLSPGPPVAYAFSPGQEPNLALHGMAAGILVDLDARRVLWYTNPFQRRPTASLAKVFTVMVALDHAQSLDQQVTVPPGGEDDNPGDSVMGLKAGDTVTVRDLVNGIWLASGDDAAETLAQSLIPRDQFIAEMNAKVAWLGLHDSHFTNPSGLDDGGVYSTPYDLAVAASWVWLHYPQAFALADQALVPLTVRGRDLTLRALNRMVTGMPGANKPYPGANGLKTGDTPNAGGCVIATAQRGSHRLIAVVMDDDWFFTDAGALLDYGFAVDH